MTNLMTFHLYEVVLVSVPRQVLVRPPSWYY